MIAIAIFLEKWSRLWKLQASFVCWKLQESHHSSQIKKNCEVLSLACFKKIESHSVPVWVISRNLSPMVRFMPLSIYIYNVHVSWTHYVVSNFQWFEFTNSKLWSHNFSDLNTFQDNWEKAVSCDFYIKIYFYTAHNYVTSDLINSFHVGLCKIDN